jgi:predicted nucleic acid-binding protein
MIAVDSSTIIAYIQGDPGPDVDLFENAIDNNQIVLPPLVITEVLCDPHLPALHRSLLIALPILELKDGFWQRAAQSRGQVLSRKLKARLGDTLIAQCCIDHDLMLIARDGDFRHFVEHCGLKLVR